MEAIVPQQPLAVVYDPPGMGNTRVPNPIAGEGTITIGDGGIVVVGNKSRDVSLLAVLAFFVALGVGIAFDLGVRLVAGIAVAAIGAVAATRFVGKRRIEVHYPWSAIKKVRYDAQRSAVVLLIKGAKPKGELFIRRAENSPLQRELEARLADRPA